MTFKNHSASALVAAALALALALTLTGCATPVRDAESAARDARMDAARDARMDAARAAGMDPASVAAWYAARDARMDAARAAALAESKKVRIGMSAKEVEKAWGRPESINRTTTASGRSEQWVYQNGRYLLYFTNGVLISMQH